MQNEMNENASRPAQLDPAAREQLESVLDSEALEAALEGLSPEQITGPGGLVTQLAGRVINAALEAEMEPAPRPPCGGAVRRRQPPQRLGRKDAGNGAG